MLPESALKRAFVALVGLACSAHLPVAGSRPAKPRTISNTRFATVLLLIFRGVRHGRGPRGHFGLARGHSFSSPAPSEQGCRALVAKNC